MLKISQQQVFERRDSLLDNLREALCSDQNADILWKICEDQHIPKEKIYIIATLAGDVIMGFLYFEDLAKEIRESLNLNPEIANSIAREIDHKIFNPIKSDLEKVYSPPVAELPEIKPIFKPEPQPSSEATAGEAKPLPAEAPLGAKEEELGPIKIPEEKPFILHQEIEAKPVAEKKKITLPATGWFKKAIPKTEAPVKVELEIFGPEKKPFDIAQGKEPPIAKTEAPKQKVVHYREAEVSTPFGKPEVKPPASVETTAGKEEPKVINLESFE